MWPPRTEVTGGEGNLRRCEYTRTALNKERAATARTVNSSMTTTVMLSHFNIILLGQGVSVKHYGCLFYVFLAIFC